MSATAAGSVEDARFAWTGQDDFTSLDDRVNADPLPLPPIIAPKRIVLVRHGQSTWNAEGRIQGSSDWSVLTDKGQDQAETTHLMLAADRFDAVYVSPLARARQTADIICRGRQNLPTTVLPALREVDLYSFQGLLKGEGRARFGEAYLAWQRRAAEFELDGHAPVRELWYRASLAWQTILGDGSPQGTLLVVAHNAVNQALVATALGLGPTYFRRLLQSNAATTVLDFSPQPGNGSRGVRVTLDRLNQSPGRPFGSDGAGRSAASRVVLVRHAATEGSRDDILLGVKDEPLSVLGGVQAGKAAELLLDLRIDTILTSPLQRCAGTAQVVAGLQREAHKGQAPPRVYMLRELSNLDVGSWQGKPARLMRRSELPADAEDMSEFWSRMDAAWARILEAADVVDTPAAADGSSGRNVVVVAHALVHAALVCKCLGLSPDALNLFRFETGGISIIDFPSGCGQAGGILRCINHTAHLGRWAVPVTQELDNVCGIDGCF